MQTIMHKHDITPWKPWNKKQQIELGMFLLTVLSHSSKWFDDVDIRYRGKMQKFVIVTDVFNIHKEEIIRISELFSPLSKPMLIEPRDWTTLDDGGYYLNQLTNCHQMVRRGGMLRIQGKTARQFLNKIQKVRYSLNNFIVEIAKELEQKKLR